MEKGIIGKTFGDFTVMKESAGSPRYYKCICKYNSNHTKKIRIDHLKEDPKCMECKKVNSHIGEVINGITVLKYIKSDKYCNKYYKFKCFCGKEFIAIYSSVNSGHTKSCGCIHNKYGDLSNDNRYKNWESMIQRVMNPNHKAYKHYHELIQGTIIESEWVKSPKGFYDEIGEKPNDKYTVDRIDNTRGYVKGNIKWSTKQEQQLNRNTKRGFSNNKYIYYDNRRDAYIAYVYIPRGRKYIGQFKSLNKAIEAQRNYRK